MPPAMILVALTAAATTMGNGGDTALAEYRKAIAWVSDSEFRVYAHWAPKSASSGLGPGMPKIPSSGLEARISGMDAATVKREFVGKFGGALQAVRVGNALPYRAPTRGMWPDDPGKTRNLAKLAITDAELRFASGDSAGAVDDLMQSVLFARRVARGTAIDSAFQGAMIAEIGSSLVEHGTKLSEADCHAIRRTVASALSGATSVITTLRNERAFALRASASQREMSRPDPLADDDAQAAAIAKTIAGWSGSEFKRFQKSLAIILGQRLAKDPVCLRSGESNWIRGFPEPGEPRFPRSKTPEKVAMYFADKTRFAARTALVAEIEVRTRLRLMGLYARVWAYRLKAGTLPTDLSFLGREALDPFSGGSFVFQRGNAGSFRIYGRGSRGTGLVELERKRSRS